MTTFSGVQTGEPRPKTVATKGVLTVRKFLTVTAVMSLGALLFAAVASASVVVPAVPVAAYGDSLLSQLGTQITAILPYAAGITAFAIGVGMLKRWLGHRKATGV
jgi:hypothetical protein